ncbi:glutathione-disulfide reductase [Peptoniphilus sp. KCTC 25270]|uniref:glutathione-disulfide reductase n=1 Tax=Peptoniphilus sp. KCTC 25270 TaxID=2897414 RepID=UPI001E380526|nr:glutathione-disulfide reductase [Peptoniphilus sp. KCTC 25270]MCD1146748.1 glutathione-disulfide reductase [Peptoniphilus sp. KCTC 25270]
MNTFDYIVIGGGSGGIATANRAAQYGKKVLLIEKQDIGGTCVNRGCVPKKVYWNGAHIAQIFKHFAKDYGFENGEPTFHFQTLKKAQESYRGRSKEAYEKGFQSRGVKVIEGEAKFVDSHTVEVNGEKFSANHITIATGARPNLLPIPGAEFLDTSETFFTWETLPEKIAVIGGGYIGTEISGLLNALGVETHFYIRKDKPLHKFEDFIIDAVMEEMEKSGIQFHTGVSPTKVEKTTEGLTLTLDNGDTEIFDRILCATGITPNSENLNLEAAGVETDKKGFILSNEWEETNVKGIYSVGDINGKTPLTPVAIMAGRKLSNRLFNGEKEAKMDYSLIPTVVFTHPAMGTIGLSLKEAEEKYGKDSVKAYTSSFVNMFTGATSHRITNKMMLVTVGEEEKIVGLHLFGEGTDEMLQGFAVAITMGATKKDFDSTIAIHPTGAEEVVTMS